MPRPTLLALVFLLAAAPTLALAEYQLEIGPDTTVIDGPLNPDGTINYLAYLNKKLSEGVTPENNFAVDVAMVMPPAPEGWPSEAFREKVFKGLGVKKPAEGPYITSIRDVIGEGEDIAFDDPRHQAWLDVISRPWKAEEHPEVKQWLDNQNDVLDRILRSASQKDRYYFPWVVKEGEPDALDSVLRPWLGTLRVIARGFQARAELNIASGNLDAALSDVRAMQLVANLSMQEPFTFSWLVGGSIHRMVASVTEDIARSEQLTSELAKQIIVDMQELDQIRPLTEAFDSCERFTSLHVIMDYWKGRDNQFFGSPFDEEMYTLMESDQYDPNVTMRAVNDLFDRWIRIGQIEDYQERLAKASQYERVSKMLFKKALKLLEGDADTRRLMRKEVSASNVTTVSATHIFVAYILPSSAIYKTEARIKMQLALAPVALAIGGYHAEHGEYPPDLNALVPEYLDSLPTDFATGELPVYRVEDDAAIVYSLGTNLKDDGGVDDDEDGDIVFRIER